MRNEKKKVSKERSTPLYLQIMEDLHEKIEEGLWHEGTMIPTEKSLCRQYGVSNITIREALKLLVKDGKLRRVPGKGTFVTKPKVEQKLDKFFSFTQWAKLNGIVPATRLIQVYSASKN